MEGGASLKIAGFATTRAWHDNTASLGSSLPYVKTVHRVCVDPDDLHSAGPLYHRGVENTVVGGGEGTGGQDLLQGARVPAGLGAGGGEAVPVGASPGLNNQAITLALVELGVGVPRSAGRRRIAATDPSRACPRYLPESTMSPRLDRPHDHGPAARPSIRITARPSRGTITSRP